MVVVLLAVAVLVVVVVGVAVGRPSLLPAVASVAVVGSGLVAPVCGDARRRLFLAAGGL